MKDASEVILTAIAYVAVIPFNIVACVSIHLSYLNQQKARRLKK